MKLYSINVLATVFSFAIITSCSKDKSSQTVHPHPVQVVLSQPERKALNSIEVSGQVQATESASLSTRMMGFITSIKAKPGDHVSKGQLLIVINSNDVQAKKAQAQAMVTEASAAMKDADKDLARMKELFDKESVSAKELENMQLHYESMKAKTEAAREMQHEAESMLAYANLTAPFDGVVTQKYVNEGSMASPGMPLLLIERLNDFEVVTSVAETEVTMISVGADSEVRIKSNGKILNGKVSEVSPSANSTGRYGVKISLPSAVAGSVYTGMHVNVAITTGAREDFYQTLLVPSASLVHEDQLNGLYTVSENKTALLRWVKTGRSFGDRIEVLSGINESEVFISSADGKLYNGVPVVTQ